MAYTTINKSSSFMNIKLHSGTGSTTTITGVGFEPSLTWWKSRNNIVNNAVYDAVRGASKLIRSNQSTQEQTNAAVSAFTSDGVTLTGGDSFTNASGYTYASWNWKANGAGSANTDGSISSTVSANTTSGFSIVKYDGAAGAYGTVGHGLGVTPKMIMVKRLDSADDWDVYTYNLPTGTNGAGSYLSLNASSSYSDNSNRWYNTPPTNNVFTVGDANTVNGSGKSYVAYCFANVQGHQKIGGYTGNNPAGGTNTQFVYTGFRPKLVMLKEISGTSNWVIYDLNRNYSLTENNYNIRAARLAWNSDNAESSFTDDHGIDILSNGFNIRDNSNDLYTINANNETYVYYAVGQTLVGTNNIPNNAV